ncbi:MAG: hypothetical protein IKP26_07175 [Clostridia bacterium]|nr:hypothetical protein [Clostridia bacterium]
MLDNNQLNSIGFRYVCDRLELLTPYGEELARHPHFYAEHELAALAGEQRNVCELRRAANERTAEVNELMRLLMPVKDIRRSIESLDIRTLTEVELFELKRFLLQLELLAPKLDALDLRLFDISIAALPKALDLIDPEGMRSPSFYVSDRLSDKLADIRRRRRKIDESIKREGLTEALSLERTRLAAEEDEENHIVRTALSEKLRRYRDALLRNAESIGRLDFALGKARLANSLGAVTPEVGGEAFVMRGMTNPRIAQALEAKGRAFVSVTMRLEKGTAVITGANMGGKSVAIKTLALNAQLAMCGFPVFAEEAKLPCLDDVCLLSEDREDAMSGLSSFGGEMKAFDSILRDTVERRCVLVMLDEFARGTNPHEGAAIVRAAARLFNGRNNAYAVIATHFDGVARLARLHYQVAGLRNADPERLRASISAGGADTLAGFMDYGLYPVDRNEEPPRDAVTIIRALGVTAEFTDQIDI